MQHQERYLKLNRLKHLIKIMFLSDNNLLGSAYNFIIPHPTLINPNFVSKNSIIIGATNRPWVLDSALLRGKRFDTQIYVGLPDKQARSLMISKSSNALEMTPKKSGKILFS